MAASTSKMPTAHPPPDASPSKPTKMKRTRKEKGKDKVVEGGRLGTGEGGESTPVEAGTSASAAEGTPWPWVSITDSSVSRRPAVFTKDGRYFFSVVGSSVKIYSVVTGLVVSTLSASPSGSDSDSSSQSGHSDLITSAVLNPQNAFQLITASLDGCIKVWDFLDAVLLQTLDLAQPIVDLTAHENFKDTVFVSVKSGSKKMTSKSGKPTEDNAAVLRVSLKPTAATAQSPIQKSQEIIAVGKTRLTHGLAVSPSGSWLVAIGGHKAYVAPTSNLKAGFTKFVSPEALTCLSFHPSEEYFATGDEKGNIRLWYCLNDSATAYVPAVEKRAPTTTLHWHAHAVSALSFTPNGAYLLSGGEEAVLVIWQLHTGKKEFVPRVGAPISSIAVSRAVAAEEEYLLGLADATFAFVNAGRLKISRTVARIKLDPAVSHERTSASGSVPLAVHSQSSTLILPSSHPSSLQTYSPSSSKLLSELEVSPSNRVSRRDEKMLEPSRVERAVISSSGEWMATVDSREGDESFRGEVYLKIWWWDRATGFWILNTRIDRPHGLKGITAVVFSPRVKDRGGMILVTTGMDGNIKSWRISSVRDSEGNEDVFWVARSSFTFRQEIPRHASWSADGSLLAVSLGPYVALYDPVTNAMLQSLTTPECQSVTSAHFIGYDGRYLAAVGQFDVVLWDLVTQTVQWHYASSSSIEAVVPHPKTETFALLERIPTVSTEATQTTRVLIFRPSSPLPSRTHTVPFRLHSVSWYPVSSSKTPKDPSSFSLVGITQTWSVVLFGSVVQAPSEEGSSAKEIVGGAAANSQRRTLFQDVFGKSAFADVSQKPVALASATSQQPWNGKSVEDIFDAPAYLMPPIESLFDDLMSDFVKPRPVETETAHDGEDGKEEEEEDAGMDVDMEQSEKPVVVAERTERVVDMREMNGFIELFRQHAIKASGPPPTSIPRPQTNGTSNGAHKPPNGVASTKTNGNSRSDAPSAYPSPASSPSQTATPIPTETSPAVLGKKRKKSLGS